MYIGQCLYLNDYNVLFELGVLCDPVQGAALDSQDAALGLIRPS